MFWELIFMENLLETRMIDISGLIYEEICAGRLNGGNNSKRLLLAKDFLDQYPVKKQGKWLKK